MRGLGKEKKMNNSPKSPLELAVARIKAYAFAERGWSRRELSRRAGVSDTVLMHVHKPGWNPTLSVLQKLEETVPDSFVYPPVSAASVASTSTTEKEQNHDERSPERYSEHE
jgi:transcriptional regulator with XRE-family HTH domain